MSNYSNEQLLKDEMLVCNLADFLISLEIHPASRFFWLYRINLACVHHSRANWSFSFGGVHHLSLLRGGV